jgi:hypothetical protein
LDKPAAYCVVIDAKKQYMVVGESDGEWTLEGVA